MKQNALLTLIMSAGLVSATVFGFWYDMQMKLDKPINISNDAGRSYIIHNGMSLEGVSNDLAALEVLNYPYYFRLDGRLRDKSAHIKAGEYLLMPDTTHRQLLEQFVAGKTLQYSLTLIEGWSYKQVRQAINNNNILVKTLPKNAEPKTVMTALGHAAVSPEGRFFPDTYYFPAGTTDIEFLRRAYNTLEQFMRHEWQSRAEGLPYETPEQALTMASIIEKETAVAEERAAIAGVFVRRLQKGMKLQTDPTVIYAMGENYSGNISRKDLQTDSPYNTYLHRGLPPTPIALPGAAAIRAALHPQAGDDLYFVARKNGTHYFSKTLAEHNAAVAKYQLGK